MMATHEIVIRGMGSFLLLLLLTQHGRGQSNEPRETYHFNTLGLADDFVDIHPGNDMLPYTDDDIELPERGNIGGTWGAAHHDLDSDGVMDEGEHIFSIIRRADDDAYTYSSLSHPEYGVIYESEDWVDYHDARNQGPSKCCLGNPGEEGNDFEHNDRPDWEGESNAYPYNNRQANQHGRGKPKYYFDHINTSNPAVVGEPYIYDEVEGFTKVLNFQHNMDDPETPLDEKGTCRREYMRSPNATTRGYLIPVDDLPDLEDGSLPSLFGWEAEGFDLAAYLRDTIEPRLEDPGLRVFHMELGTDPDLLLPITHLMLFQIECPIEVNSGNLCDPADARAQAGYWGIPEEGATYRVSHIMGYNEEVTEILFGDSVRPWLHEPEDGEARNLWLLDHFYRDDISHRGRYQLLPQNQSWSITEDQAFATIDGTINKVLQTSGPGMVYVALPKTLEADELPLEFVADVGTDKRSWAFHLVLLSSGFEVKAYAEISSDGSLVHLGGEVSAEGQVSGGAGAEGPEVLFGSVRDGDYSRYVLKVEPGRVSLLEAPFEDYQPSDFTGLNRDDMDELVSLDVDDPARLAGVSHVGIATNGPGVVSTIAVLAAPPPLPRGPGGLRRPGDCNSDGITDISDVICLLGHLFLGDPSVLPCGDGKQDHPANRSLLDSNGDNLTDVSDAVFILGFLFLGTDQPPVLGRDCTLIEGCEDACTADAP